MIDTDGVVVLLLLLLLRVEDTALVDVLLLTMRDVDDPEDDTGVFVEDESAVDGAGDGADASNVVLVDDGDGDDDDDDDNDDDGVEGVSEACAAVEEAAERRLVEVETALGVSVTVLTETVVAVAEESVTVLYTTSETVVGASDSTTVETTVVCAASVLVGAEPPSTLTTA